MRFGIEDRDVGVPARFEPAAVPEAEDARGAISHQVDRVDEGDHVALTHRVAEHDRRVVAVAHQVDVRARVRTAQ